MINIIQYPQDTHFVKPLFLIGLGITIHEIISYPLDRIVTRMIAKSPYQNQSFSEQLKQIKLAESIKGLYKGFRTSFDRSIIQNLSFYFCFQYFFLRYGLEFNSRTRIEVKDQPYLKYCENAKFYGIAFGSAILSTIFSQPSSVVNIKLQCEQLGLPPKKYWDNMKHLEEIMNYHNKKFKIAFTPGFKSKVVLLYCQFVTEITIFQEFLYQQGYQFMNKNVYTNCDTKNNHFIGALATSLLVPIIFHPLNFLQKRYMIRKLQNMKLLTPQEMLKQDISKLSTLYCGFGAEVFRYSSRSMLIFYLIWNSANQTTKY
ncbi:unnamed protein product [Paramecium pentaurelia]|uniref:Mitochondrial carrier protein n=1 Tax=Paramecium pentaurelia TaxID=43138 RepID=A0A8S1TD08_9CILI|nr:unnamed protein product [Paramecium pentaurelia]